MSKQTLRHKIDPANLPPLTENQKAELAALDNRQIDTSDFPELTKEFWDNAARGRFYKPTKTSTTVRIDTDVLAWLRAQGKGYQSRINAILRREMLSAAAKGISTWTVHHDKGGAIDSRHRDKYGEIGRKHGHALIGALRKHYGAGFAAGFKDTDTLAQVLAALDEPSLTKLTKDHKAGRLRVILGAAA